VQHSVNHSAIERAAAELLSGPRADIYVAGLLTIAVASSAGAALATIWLGLALLAAAARAMLIARLGEPAGLASRLSLDIATAASFATAPAIAWFGRAEFGPALAITLLLVLTTRAAVSGCRSSRYTLAACAPYGLLGLIFLIDAAAAHAFAAIAISGIACAYVFASIIQQQRTAAYAQVLNAEWVRQLNMNFGKAKSAAWELDFASATLSGGERLAGLLGRSVTFRDIVATGCFAAPGDHGLAKTVFSPNVGAPRRIAFEHDAISSNGNRVRLRHQGFVHTTPDGTPVRLFCITEPSTRAGAAAGDETPIRALALLDDTLNAQARTLTMLRNELGAGVEIDPPARPLPASENAVEQIAHRAALIDSGRRAVAAAAIDLVRARDTAEAANLAKSQFLANMSHELRTPLNAVIGYAEMLQEDAEDRADPSAVKDLDRILGAARHLLGLINEVLDLSKIEAGRVEVTPTAFDVAELLEDALATVRPLAVENGNSITLEAAPGMATTDAAKVRQCMLNLLSNACKFTHDGKIDVLLERRMLNGIEHVIVTVSDTGIGMSPEHMSKLFQPFVQADPSITQRFGGTGLGLTITRRLANLLGGEVSVESELAQGAAFTLAVPADFADAATALGAAAQVDDVQGAPGAPLVIVIEDEPDARELAARSLTRAGFAVQGVGGGEAGLALARVKSPALVLLDIFLPDRSGWRVLQTLKQDVKTQDIPVIVLSVNEDRAHAMALGAAEHIVKPADRDMLAAAVMRYARKRPSEQAAAPSIPDTKKQAG
jgi:signal transduction histidine kinase/CheY-like chemotaxis protein